MDTNYPSVDTYTIHIYPLVDNLLMYICFKCNHQWYERSDIPPRRCPNHSCRTVSWGKPLDVKPVAQKKPAEASPIVDKKTELDGLRAIMDAVKEKPKSDYHTKSILPQYPPVDQADYYDTEKSVNYD